MPSPAAKPAAPAPTPAPPVAPSKPSVVGSQAPTVPLTPQPPDGKWLVDEEGRQYFLGNAPRIEGSYMWMNDEHTKVRLPYGLTFDVASYDDKAFKVKIYKGDDTPVKVPGQTTRGGARKDRRLLSGRPQDDPPGDLPALRQGASRPAGSGAIASRWRT